MGDAKEKPKGSDDVPTKQNGARKGHPKKSLDIGAKHFLTYELSALSIAWGCKIISRKVCNVSA